MSTSRSIFIFLVFEYSKLLIFFNLLWKWLLFVQNKIRVILNLGWFNYEILFPLICVFVYAAATAFKANCRFKLNGSYKTQFIFHVGSM